VFLRLQSYERPAELAEAVRLLGRSEPRTRALAGGTAVVGPVDDETEVLVDLSGLGLRHIRPDTQTVRLGAMTTLDDLVRSPEVMFLGGGLVAQAAERTAPATMLARATVGGALARPDRAPELVAALLALDAGVVTVDRELGRTMSSADAVPAGGLIEEVQIPATPVVSAFERLARTPRDLATVAVYVALHVEDGTCRHLRLAAAGLGDRPQRLTVAEAALQAKELSASAIERAAAAVRESVTPPDDFRGSAEYRRELAEVLVRRALTAARDAALQGRK